MVSEMEEDLLDKITEVVELKKENPMMSIQTMNGGVAKGCKTLEGIVYTSKKPLHILVNFGSTYNFLDVKVFKCLECRIDTVDPLRVNVPDKNSLVCMAMIKKMKKEQLVARFIQHGSKSYLICSKVSRIS